MKLILVYTVTTIGSVTWGQQAQAEYEPVFLENLDNQTVVQGRDVFFTCVVNHLGEYRVAWIKSDSKTILAVHTHMVAHNNRISVTHNGHNTWKLKVSNVQKNDSGSYMCQINTDPMRSQMGHLSVQVPPDVVDEDGSRDHVTVERGSLQLVCRATGIPPPKVTWKREDGKNIIIRTEGHKHQVVRQLEGEVLELTNVQRTDMGPYMCIASNGVPPSVSKRYQVQVHFQPDVKAASQLVAAPAGSNVTLECYVETSPKAMNIWTRETGEKLDSSSTKYIMEEKRINEYSLNMRLTIGFLEKRDFGGYNCSSVNAIGQADFTVRLQELDIPKTTSLPATHDSGRRKRPPVERTQPPPTKRRKRPTTTEEMPVEQPPVGPVTLPPWLVDEENEVDNRSGRQGSSSVAVCILALGLLAWILC